MPRTDLQIANAIRSALSDRIGVSRYQLWFGDDVSLTFDGETVRISTGQQFRLDQIRRGLTIDLQAACQQVLGQTTPLVFEVSESPTVASPKAESPTAAPNGTLAGEKLAEDSNAAEESNGQTARATTQAHGSRGATSIRLHSAPRGRRFAHLESFVEGKSNRLALTAARLLLEQGQRISPLFMHGPHGVGKTHLLEGIYCTARRSGQMRRTLYMSAEQFTNSFLEALRGSGLPNFRRRYRDVDMLLIDDVQFFAGKRSTIIELQHTIDNLLREGRHIVLAADRPPQELSSLGAELINRLSGGLVCPIESHDFTTRVGILQSMAGERGFSVPVNVIEQLARELSGDARLLSGALNRLHAASAVDGRPISMELAEQALEDLFRAAKPLVRLNDIDQAVCDVFGLELSTLQSNSRSKWISQPRMLAMWLARKYTRAAFVEIGEYFGRRSHSTVVSAQQKVERWISDGTPIRGTVGNWRIDEAVRRVESKLGAG